MCNLPDWYKRSISIRNFRDQHSERSEQTNQLNLNKNRLAIPVHPKPIKNEKITII